MYKYIVLCGFLTHVVKYGLFDEEGTWSGRELTLQEACENAAPNKYPEDRNYYIVRLMYGMYNTYYVAIHHPEHAVALTQMGRI